MNEEELEEASRKYSLPRKINIKGVYAIYADASGTTPTEMLELRLKLNLDDTGHPFHHKTKDGTIVEPDPAVEYLISVMPAEDRKLVLERWLSRIRPDAPAAQPVDRIHYGYDFLLQLARTQAGRGEINRGSRTTS